MILKRWIPLEHNEPAAKQLQAETGLPLFITKLLVQRGIESASDVDDFFHPQLRQLPDPNHMKDLDIAAKRLADAVQNQESVALYGDYDVDGVTSTSLLSSFLEAVGLATRFYIPKRLTEGYGLNSDAVDTLAKEGVRLLITLDCGITATKEIERANEHGIETIVVDHHRCPPALPDAFATLNPQQEDCHYPDKGLAAVGVCFNLVVGVRKELRDRGYFEHRPQPDVREYLDLVALGTIADMVPLMHVNRTLAWHGLQQLNRTRRVGLRALMEVSKTRYGRCSSSDVGFRLGPRINAAGRLDNASIGVQLLLSKEMSTARKHAETLDLANRRRQDIEAAVFRDCCKQIDLMDELPAALVLYDQTWHPGVVGIVATKIVERYDRPTIIIGEGGRGSGRTAQGLHLYDAMNSVREKLMKFGGHRAAAGLTIAPQNIDDFRRDFCRFIEANHAEGATESLLEFDETLTPEQCSDDLIQMLEKLQPYGNGNPQPLFVSSQMEIASARIVGKDHLKLRLNPGGLSAIAFKRGDLYDDVPPGQKIEIAFYLEKSEFNGNEYIELRARDLRPVSDP